MILLCHLRKMLQLDRGKVGVKRKRTAKTFSESVEFNAKMGKSQSVNSMEVPFLFHGKVDPAGIEIDC